MEILIGLIVVAAFGYAAYKFFVRPTSDAPKSVEVVAQEPVVEQAVQNEPVVALDAEPKSVEVQNTEIVPEVVPAKKAKAKVRAKTAKAAKPKKPKLEIAK